MWIRRLTLSHFRNYRKQQLDLRKGITLLLGDNAQGKSNLLEAVFFLATTRSERAATDAELICWEALDEPQPVARVTAAIESRGGPLELEALVVGRPKPGARARVPASKRLRVNGAPKRQIDVIGQLTAVLFTTHDLDLIGGPPAGRRRYLDVTLSQLDREYARALQRYNKVVTQRNALLRRIQEGASKTAELSVWDEQLARDGATIVCARAAAVEALARHARAEHERVSGGLEHLAIGYLPRIEGWDGARVLAQPHAVEDALVAALEAGRRREIGAGLTLAGPHRDDLAFALDGAAASSFASRGQQRTAAFALRLAEARYMAERKVDLPVVLLDDVLSELDEARRRAVLASLDGWDQLLITSADGHRFEEGLPSAAAVLCVVAGRIEPA
jgi:DNA replication and repair protein RecF